MYFAKWSHWGLYRKQVVHWPCYGKSLCSDTVHICEDKVTCWPCQSCWRFDELFQSILLGNFINKCLSSFFCTVQVEVSQKYNTTTHQWGEFFVQASKKVCLICLWRFLEKSWNNIGTHLDVGKTQKLSKRNVKVKLNTKLIRFGMQNIKY